MSALTTKQIARLKELGIDTDKEPVARKKLVAILEKNDVPDCENDSIDNLIEMAMVFKDDEVEEEEVVDDVEDEEEEVKPAKKQTAKNAPVAKGKSKKPVAEEDEEEDEEMGELAEEVTSKNLKSTVAKDKKKPVAKTKTHKRKLLGKRWAELTDAEKKKALLPFYKYFPKDKFEIRSLQDSFTVSYLGKTGQQNICKYHLLRLLDNGKLEGVFVSHRFKTPEELQERLTEEMLEGRTLKQGDSCSYIHPLNQDEVIEILKETDFLEESIKRAKSQDTKMQVNRANLEKSLKDDKKAAPTPTGKKPVKKQAEEEDEEEEEAPAPAKKSVKVVSKGKIQPEPEVEDEEEEAPAPKSTVKKPAAKPVTTGKKKK